MLNLRQKPPRSTGVCDRAHAISFFTPQPRPRFVLVSLQWQAGAITALQERYDMSSLDAVGASAGALAATLAACDADMDLAMTIALDLCDANQVLPLTVLEPMTL